MSESLADAPGAPLRMHSARTNSHRLPAFAFSVERDELSPTDNNNRLIDALRYATPSHYDYRSPPAESSRFGNPCQIIWESVNRQRQIRRGVRPSLT